jgi:FixJ family two-component response regulator
LQKFYQCAILFVSCRTLGLDVPVRAHTRPIGRALGISHRTVEEYLVNIRIKTGASSKAELIEMTIDEFVS